MDGIAHWASDGFQQIGFSPWGLAVAGYADWTEAEVFRPRISKLEVVSISQK